VQQQQPPSPYRWKRCPYNTHSLWTNWRIIVTVKRLSSLLFAVLFKSINFTSPLSALPSPSAINPINQRAHQVKCTDRGIYFSWLLPCDSLHFLIFFKAAGSNLAQSRPLLLHVGILGSLCTQQTADLATDYLILASLLGLWVPTNSRRLQEAGNSEVHMYSLLTPSSTSTESAH
jgi:hypothetical protein